MANEQMIKFWCWSGSQILIRIRIRIRIATLVRRALAEECTVPVLLVLNFTNVFIHKASEKWQTHIIKQQV